MASLTPSALPMPHETLTPVNPDEPMTPKVLRATLKELYANAAAIKCTAGQNNTGYLGVAMPSAQFLALPGITANFPRPAQPVPPALVGQPINQANQKFTYECELRNYNQFIAVESKLKNQLIAAIPPIYLEDVGDATLGFTTCSCRRLVKHLLDHNGTITPNDMDDNREDLEAEWDPMTPIETIFTRGKLCRDFATLGLDPITDASYMRALIKVLNKSGVFGVAIHEWNNKAAAEKTPRNLKIFFVKANKERLVANPTTRGMLEQANAARQQQPPATLEGSNTSMYYCWTHGLGYNKSHTSATCTSKGPGHQDNATCTHKLGGNCTIRRQNGERAIYRRPPPRDNNRNNNNNNRTNNDE